ncbi:phage minor head protein [Ihuprevotella massiliensis]|uniref:phage minor head protein n=1 Tax=Ihuprevotella massiliensis TaxID=1852368 RepID=UPI00094EB8CD
MRSDNSKAAKWEQYERDEDRYYLQYRTVGDSHVREEHAALKGTALPVSHLFWDTHFQTNGWNCRCLAVQVRNSSHEQTSEEELSKRTKALAEQQAKSKARVGYFVLILTSNARYFPTTIPTLSSDVTTAT